MKSSRTRLSEYINLFSQIDELRLDLLTQITNLTLDGINVDDSVEEERQADILVNKLEFVNSIAENIIVGFVENGELNGN